jgi:streptogramin lyase
LLDRIDCDLALGRHEQVLGEVNLLVREHPLRERFRAQQMLALYRAGRQADALDAYAEARRALVDDLGIEPSDALQRLQHAILRHDPSLETPEGTAAVNGRRRGVAPPPTIDGARSRRRLRPRRPALAAAGLLVVAAAVAGAVAFSTSSARATPRVVPNSLVRFDPRRGKVVSVVSVGVEPGPIAITPNAIWTANTATISRYDLRTHHVETRGDFPYQPEDSTNDIVADGKGSVWVTSETPLLTRFVASRGGAEPLRRWRSEEIRVPGPGVGDEALGAGYLWTIPGPYTYPGADDRVSLIDPRTNRLVDSVRLGHATTALAFGFGTAWVGAFVNDASDTSGSSPNGQKVLTGPSWLFAIRAGDALSQTYLDRHPIRRLLETGDAEGPGGIAVGEGAVWVLTCPTCNLGSDHRTLEEVDPDTLRVHRIGLPAHADFLTAGAGAVWLASESEGILWRLDPKRGRIVHAYRVGRPHAVICHIRAAPNAIWIAVGDSRC